MEQTLSSAVLTPFPPEKQDRVDRLLAEAVDGSRRKIVVLDDDPTGVQTVHGVSVYTDWSLESLREGFAEPGRLFFVLTNSRGFTAAQTAAAHRDIIDRTVCAARECGMDFLIVSRGDSTLRGHYPLETRVLAEGMARAGQPPDGEILCPFFREGGRLTLEDTHYIRSGDALIPVAQTEFARDATFGYAHSDLRAYIEEKTEGAYRACDVLSITLDELRAADIDGITAKLAGVHEFGKVVVNATEDADIRVFCIALYRALALGKRFCYRTAASFVKVLGGIGDRPLLRRDEMVARESAAGGMVVVGSHTQKTTAQLAELTTLRTVRPIEMNSDLVLEPGALATEVARIAAECDRLLGERLTPVVYTRRAVLTLPGDTPEAALMRSVRISEAVQALVGNLTVTPAFLVAKGGITSSDIGTKALRVRRATVLGQVCPGVPVWKTGAESRFPGLAYVIFPGNVGEATTLRDAVATLTGEECPLSGGGPQTVVQREDAQ